MLNSRLIMKNEEKEPNVLNINMGKLGGLLDPMFTNTIAVDTIFGSFKNIEVMASTINTFNGSQKFVPNFWSIKLLMMYTYFKDLEEFKSLPEDTRFTSYNDEGVYQLNRGRYCHALELVLQAVKSDNPNATIVSLAMLMRDEPNSSLLDEAAIELTDELLEFLES